MGPASLLPPHEPEPGEVPLGTCPKPFIEPVEEPIVPGGPDQPLVEIKAFGFVKWEKFF